MISTLNSYTTKNTGKMLEVDPLSLINILVKDESNSAASFSIPNSWILRFEPPVVLEENYRDRFIGILTDEEAESMKKDLRLFKKRFNDDFARKNEILFGH